MFFPVRAEGSPPQVLPDRVAAEPSPEAIRDALARLLSDAAFATSPQLTRFLRYVVEETLAGRGDALKEYTVGVNALGRPTTFDPTNDSSVRAAARQLRLKLAAYAAGAGRDATVAITLPKGSYRPAFLPNAASPPTPSVAPSAWARGLMITTVVVLLSLAGVVAVRAGRDSAGAAPETPATVAVLPVVNLTADSATEHVTDALTDEITLSLARTSALRVVARTSTFALKGRKIDAREIGRMLGATFLLEGTMREVAGRWRIGVQLIDAADGLERWSGIYDVDRRDAAEVYVTIAAAVVEEINRRSSTRATFRSPPVVDSGARRLYQEARYLWGKRTPESLRRSVTLYEAALARDSTFALAAAGLADSHATMAVNNVTAPGVSPPLAMAAAKRAIALDPTLGEPHATLGLMRAFHEWDWNSADTEFATAIALSPNYPTAYSWHAITLHARARFDEALQQLARAQRLDPLSTAIAYNRAELLYNARRWPQALAAIDRVLELEPAFQPAFVLQGRVLAAQRNLPAARAAFVRANDSLSLAQEVDTAPNFAPLRAQLRALGPVATGNMPYWMGVLQARMGQTDSAFVWLGRAYEARHLNIVALRVEPGLDPIRADPRFAAMLRRLRLDDASLR
jgi:TolB-like protein